MKYRLKKDLPFAKAGAEVVIGVKGGIDLCQYNNNEVNISEEHISRLIVEGWIEEVKPREWEVNEWMGDIYNKGSIIMTTADQIQPKRIKVREVIE